jgi:benzoate transport
MASTADPRATLLAAPMSRAQWVAVAITVALCALDGFDILAITFASPGIVASWGITKAQLGIVFGVGLFGIAAGSLLIAPLADVYGRRPMIIGCLILMAVGMFFGATAHTIVMLTVWRLLTGLGIGAMVATTNPLAAEYANAHRRDLAVGVLNVGFPIGGVLGGAFVAWLLRHHDWRSIFIFGGSLSLVMLPLVLFFMPEPVGFLIEQRAPRALERVNAFLGRCGQQAVTALPPATSGKRAGVARLADIFGRDLFRTTLHVAAIFFLTIMTVFYMLSWMPQMVADLGFPASAAATVSVAANLGGVVGGVLLGWLAGRYGVKRLTLLAMFGMGISTALFGRAPADLLMLKLAAALAGFFIFATMIGLYSVISRTFPTHVRATGTGFTIGIGRIGSALSPFLAGLLFSSGFGRAPVSLIMATAVVLGAGLLAMFNVRAPTN